ncbi:MAG: tetratricopeptide repeat protein [Methylovirgula sp.]
MKPHDPDILDNLALALKDLSRLDEAAECARRALAIEGRDPKLHIHAGVIFLDQHKIDEAGTAAAHALALNPNDHDVLNLMGRSPSNARNSTSP